MADDQARTGEGEGGTRGASSGAAGRARTGGYGAAAPAARAMGFHPAETGRGI